MPTKEKTGQTITNPHDKAFKQAFQVKKYARKFFEQFLPPEFNRCIDYDYMELKNKSYVDEHFLEKHSDIVYTVRIKDKTAFLYILFEHQSAPDHWMAFRILCYMINIWKEFQDQYKDEQYLPVIIPVVFYHGKTGWTSPKGFIDLISGGSGFEKLLPGFEYHLVNCRDYSNENLIQMCDDLALGVLLFMLKNIHESGFDHLMESLANLLEKLRDHPDVISIVKWAITYAFYARDEEETTVEKIVKRNFSRLKDQKIMEAAMSVAEKIEKRGIERGIEQGIEKERHSLLIRQLKIRFAGIPESLEQKIIKADMETLNKIVGSIFDLQTIEDVERLLNQ